MLLVSVASQAAQWPQFRGPHAGGQADGPAAPTTWNAESGQNIRWRTPVPELAHASPIVWDARVFAATAVKPGEPGLKVGLYGSIGSVTANEPVQWRLVALNLASGEIRFSERLPAGQASTASPVASGGNLVFTSEPGKVYVVPTGDKFSITSTNDLDETCLATQALANGPLTFRTRGQVVSVGTRN